MQNRRQSKLQQQHSVTVRQKKNCGLCPSHALVVCVMYLCKSFGVSYTTAPGPGKPPAEAGPSPNLGPFPNHTKIQFLYNTTVTANGQLRLNPLHNQEKGGGTTPRFISL